MFKWFRYSRFKLPISRSPDTNCSIVRLSRKKFSDRVPADTFDETLMKIEFGKALESIAAPNQDFGI